MSASTSTPSALRNASPGEVGDPITAITLHQPLRRGWLSALLLAALAASLFVGALIYLMLSGVGIWGINIPVAWGFAIANYVWWIGIAMSGTFISAALLLLRQPWRAGISRFAETMTVIALIVASLFPLIHLGRPWFAYWLFPYPNSMGLWPQWNSALVWDFVALACYLVVSLLFWYLGMLPDLASLRDRASRRGQQVFYGLLALGWRGEAAHWRRYRTATRLLAGFAIALVFMVHSMVALDFSEGLVPGWHSTLFPPFFVAGALFSGFAMVLTLSIPLRRFYRLQRYITNAHLDKLARLLLVGSLLMLYSYGVEVFGPLYTGERYELAMIKQRLTGTYGSLYWSSVLLNGLLPQLLWSRRLRSSENLLLLIGLGVIIGMWLERYMLVVSTLYRDFMPSAWGVFLPTFWDWAHLLGSISLFVLLFLLFLRLLPLLALHEIRQQLHEGRS